jgi:secreted trypsin-like serine protease
VAGVYTRIKVYLDWLNEHIKSGECKEQTKKT